MTEFVIDEAMRIALELKIRQLVPNNLRLNLEVQDAGGSVFVRIYVMLSTTVEEIVKMSDEIEVILLNDLPLKDSEPRWAQAYLLGGKVVYTNLGGFNF